MNGKVKGYLWERNAPRTSYFFVTEKTRATDKLCTAICKLLDVPSTKGNIMFLQEKLQRMECEEQDNCFSFSCRYASGFAKTISYNKADEYLLFKVV